MTSQFALHSPLKTARTAGLLYTLIAVAGGFSMGYLPSVLIVPGDAAATAANILAQPDLYRLGTFADIVVLFAEIVVTSLLYSLFRGVNASIALAAAFARLAMVLVMGVNLVFSLLPTLVLGAGGATYLAIFTPEQLQAIAMLSLDAKQLGVYVWGLFFGAHLTMLGYLVFRSTFLPRVFGLLLAAGSIGYIVQSLGALVLPGNQLIATTGMVFLGFAVIGEISFALWLLVKGLNESAWNTRAQLSAAA